MVQEKQKTTTRQDSVSILLVGNNPIELSRMLETIKKLPNRVTAEIAFDLASIWQRLVKFRPNFILIDDNIGLQELSQTVSTLSANPKTKNVPITVLKNSNYTGSIVSSDIADYILKQHLTPEALYIALRNSLRFQQARKYLAKAYAKRKRELLKLIR
jgi:DNA-binding NarL/FixJ family response regulator